MINKIIYLIISTFVIILYSALIGFEFGLQYFTKHTTSIDVIIYSYVIIMFLSVGFLYSKIDTDNKDKRLIVSIFMYIMGLIVMYNFFSKEIFSTFINFRISIYVFYILPIVTIFVVLFTSQKVFVFKVNRNVWIKSIFSFLFGFSYYAIKSSFELNKVLKNEFMGLSQMFILVTCLVLPSIWLIDYVIKYIDLYPNGTKLSLLNTFFTSMRKLFHLTSWHGHQLTWFRPSFNTSGLIPA